VNVSEFTVILISGKGLQTGWMSLIKRLTKFVEKIMAKITLGGNPVNTSGNLPAKGSKAPDFTLVDSDLGTLSLSAFRGKKVLMNIFPSLETSICSTSIRKFNQLAAGKSNTVVLAISKDLPFAHKRFCSTEGITNVISLSGFRDSEFGKAYGVDMTDGSFAGLYARSVIIVDEVGNVIYTQLVPEIGQEPDYDSALASV
jgi:thioredoxin-dependent peroxiredoxin